jgi:hypothetical protein
MPDVNAQTSAVGATDSTGLQYCRRPGTTWALDARTKPLALMRPLFGAVALFCIAAHAQTASPSASPPARRFELTWQAPADCPSQQEVAREIEELIAQSPGVPQAAPISAQALVRWERDGFALALGLKDMDSSRSRHIGAPTCEELGHATALIIAMAIDPTILERRSDRGNSTDGALTSVEQRCSYHCRLTDLPPPSTPSRIASPADVPAMPEAQPNQTALKPLFWRLGVGTFGAFGVLPGFNLGVSLLGAIQSKVARFELGASLLSANVQSTTVRSRSAEFDLYRVAPRGCWLIGKRNWAAGPCASAEFGMIQGKGSGVPNFRTQQAFWLAGAAGVMLELRLAASSLLALNANFLVPWSDRFHLAGEPMFEPKISASLGVSLATGW